MTVGALLFWLFIGGPIALTVLYWILMAICVPFFAAGAGARAVKENRADKRQAAVDLEIKRLDDDERAHLTQRRSA